MEAPQFARYRFLDYFRQEWVEVKCIVITPGAKTSVIALFGLGPRGRQSGDIMRVHNKSLRYDEPAEKPVPEWHEYTDI